MKNLPEQRDVVLVPLSDMHTGSTTALFPHYKDLKDGYWQFKHTRYTPSEKQCEMAAHFDKCADEIAKMRKGKRLIVVENGDLIDGQHHQTLQLTTHNTDEQQEVHVWLMRRFFKRAGFDKSRGDLFYVVSGTETHTEEKEDYIAQELGAEQTSEGGDLFDFLPLEINGKLFWFLHQGGGPGKGANMGDSLRNWLKNKYWELVERGYWGGMARLPDMIISGHYHIPVKASYEKEHHIMRGLILPSFQRKTRFGYKIAAAEMERIGVQTVEIDAGGGIRVNPIMAMSQKDETVKA